MPKSRDTFFSSISLSKRPSEHILMIKFNCRFFASRCFEERTPGEMEQTGIRYTTCKFLFFFKPRHFQTVSKLNSFDEGAHLSPSLQGRWVRTPVTLYPLGHAHNVNFVISTFWVPVKEKLFNQRNIKLSGFRKFLMPFRLAQGMPMNLRNILFKSIIWIQDYWGFYLIFFSFF